MKLWVAIEFSSCKQVSMVELLERFISQSFFKWLNCFFAGLIRPFDIVYSLLIFIEEWNCVSCMLKNVMCISLPVISMMSKLNTCPDPLTLVKVRRSIFERTLTFNVHSYMYGSKYLIGVNIGGVLVFSNWCFLGELTSLFNNGPPIIYDVIVCTYISWTIRILQNMKINVWLKSK